jgi:hypothetical protein
VERPLHRGIAQTVLSDAGRREGLPDCSPEFASALGVVKLFCLGGDYLILARRPLGKLLVFRQHSLILLNGLAHLAGLMDLSKLNLAGTKSLISLNELIEPRWIGLL